MQKISEFLTLNEEKLAFVYSYIIYLSFLTLSLEESENTDTVYALMVIHRGVAVGVQISNRLSELNSYVLRISKVNFTKPDVLRCDIIHYYITLDLKIIHWVFF